MSDQLRQYLRKAKFLHDVQIAKVFIKKRGQCKKFNIQVELILSSLNELKYDQFCLVLKRDKQVKAYIRCKKCKRSQPWNVIHSILYEEKNLVPDEVNYLKIIKDNWDFLVPKLPMATWTSVINKCYQHSI